MDDDLCQMVTAINAAGERRGLLSVSATERERNLADFQRIRLAGWTAEWVPMKTTRPCVVVS